MKHITAHIIIIGDEVLFGQILDTNSHFMAQQLSKINLDLIQISTIKDDFELIKAEILSSVADVIITTGGLGPTRDDKTKYVLAEILNKPLEIDSETLEWTTAYFEKVAKRPMNDLNKNQALVPRTTTPLRNKVGTAPGLWSEFNKQIIINLPGVPHEMKYLIQNEVIARLVEKFEPDFTLHQFIQIINIPESELAEMLAEVEDNFPEEIKLAYLPHGKRIRLRLTATGKDENQLKSSIENQVQKILKIIPEENLLGLDNNSLDERIAQKLNEKNYTIATAESFTAGLLASRLAVIEGSSQYLKGGIIAYANSIKAEFLNISNDIIENKGVVNQEVAAIMAKEVQQKFKTDIAISSTGVAGPGSDDFGNEPGLAFIGLAIGDKVEVYEYFYPNLTREEFTNRLADIALQKLFLKTK